jgi:hypothetical protein
MRIDSMDHGSLLPDAKSLERLAISASGFIFDPVSGHSFTVNETGLEILRHLQHQRDLDPLRARLQADYDVAPTQLDRDLVEFLSSLRDQLLKP